MPNNAFKNPRLKWLLSSTFIFVIASSEIGSAQTNDQALSIQPLLVAQEKPSTLYLQTSSSSSSSSGQAAPGATADDGWHLALSPYLWFAGSHGDVGALGRTASVHASPWDLLSHFDIGLMGAADASKKRLVLSGDMIWIRVSDSKALPGTLLGATNADVRLGQFIWTSKGGVRLIDRKGMKADATVGVRYWHVGQKLNFDPSALGLNFSSSLNWADILVGGRVQLPVGQKAEITLGGDVGGWNAAAKLDYQFATLLGFKVSPKWTLQAGYRYLFIDYRPGPGSVLNTVTSGAILGATWNIK
jgi:hypothetical protein